MAGGGPVSQDWTPSPRANPGFKVAVHEGDIHGRVVTTVVADSSGAFSVDLPPGRYTLAGAVEPVEPETVTVERGKYVEVTLMVHMP